MPYERLSELLEPAATVQLTVECQQGVVGEDGALPGLAVQARTSGALDNVARLVAAAHDSGVQVIHAIAERRPDGRGAGRTVVVPADAIAGVPADYASAMIRNTLALVATVTTTDEVLVCFVRPRHGS